MNNSNRKSALFCPSCGYKSSLGGDWKMSSASDQYQLRCPNCGSVVVTQSQYCTEYSEIQN
ncbi:double zinc ribbon domain-containing protein [Salinibaculum rarum]|uniref:double zinc ribbon domain-containing protein n=1 Tax=Salinibaculum rarum TaxID=3058903 RepID=UPI0034E9493D